MRTAVTTGTVPDLNQKRAKRIKAMIGVTLIILRGKAKKALKDGWSEESRPEKNPIRNDKRKAIITRKMVKAKAFQNIEVFARLINLSKTVCGKGRISGARIIAATAYHSRIRKKGEMIFQKISFFINQ